MLLVVSQFTLLASTKKGSKPDFHGAANGEVAKELYDTFFARVQELYDPVRVKNGVYKAMMEVALVNDGPVGVDYHSDDGMVKPDMIYMFTLETIFTNSTSVGLGDVGDPNKPTSCGQKERELDKGI